METQDLGTELLTDVAKAARRLVLAEREFRAISIGAARMPRATIEGQNAWDKALAKRNLAQRELERALDWTAFSAKEAGQ